MTEAAPTSTEQEQARDLVARAEAGDEVAIAQIEARDRSLAAQREVENAEQVQRNEEAEYRVAVEETPAREFATGLAMAKHSQAARCAMRAELMVNLIEGVNGDVINVTYGVNQQGHSILIHFTAPPAAIPGLQRRIAKAAEFNPISK